jgi:hypothetical protein
MARRRGGDPWTRLDAALRTLSFTGYAASSVTEAGVVELPTAVAAAERTFTELSSDFHWREIAGKLSALSSAVDFVAMRVDDSALDLIFGRSPTVCDPAEELEFGNFLKRVLLDMSDAGRDFELAEETASAAQRLIEPSAPGPGAEAAKLVLPLLRFAGTINAVVVVAVPEASPELRDAWASTDLSWRLDDKLLQAPAGLTVWLWVTSTGEVLEGSYSMFDFARGSSIANMRAPDELAQCLRFTA